jgi:hypothetical protein
VDHHPLDGCSLGKEFPALGLGHLLLVPVMMKQFLNSPEVRADFPEEYGVSPAWQD